MHTPYNTIQNNRSTVRLALYIAPYIALNGTCIAHRPSLTPTRAVDWLPLATLVTLMTLRSGTPRRTIELYRTNRRLLLIVYY